MSPDTLQSQETHWQPPPLEVSLCHSVTVWSRRACIATACKKSWSSLFACFYLILHWMGACIRQNNYKILPHWRKEENLPGRDHELIYTEHFQCRAGLLLYICGQEPRETRSTGPEAEWNLQRQLETQGLREEESLARENQGNSIFVASK